MHTSTGRTRKSDEEVRIRFEKFVNFADANWYVDSLNLEYARRQFGLNRRSVHRHFRRRNTTWTEFYLGRKVSEAARLIREDGTMVKVAIMLVGWPRCGKGWLGRFHRRFRKMHGLLPGEYRNAHRKVKGS